MNQQVPFIRDVIAIQSGLQFDSENGPLTIVDDCCGGWVEIDENDFVIDSSHGMTTVSDGSVSSEVSVDILVGATIR